MSLILPIDGEENWGPKLRAALVKIATDATTNLNAHIIDPTPHPAYDDVADLVVQFENGLI